MAPKGSIEKGDAGSSVVDIKTNEICGHVFWHNTSGEVGTNSYAAILKQIQLLLPESVVAIFEMMASQTS
ncbi:hypothetical protein BGZ63DRAFT_429281 [Mariannaea sp. PMI_226]|nr:hypothetical protein BGZ63DRAFT_429281 [Mariannaea sp. PMI_226]